jgi:outer membrane murein-binding lipoprotein Lpp
VKKLIVLFCAVLVVFPLVMTGCGVAKSDYEAVVAERDTLQTEKNTVQAEKDALETERDELQAELSATKSDVTSLVAELDKKLVALVMVDGYFSDALNYIAGEMSESDATEALTTFIAGFGGVLDDVGNDELSQLWDNAVAASELGDVEEFISNFTAIMALLEDLINDDIAAIEARLS